MKRSIVLARIFLLTVLGLVPATPARAFSVAEGCSAYPDNPAVGGSVFDWAYYTKRYADLGKAGIDTPEKACAHWVRFGIAERRTGRDVQAPDYATATNADFCAGLPLKSPALIDPRVFNWQFYLNANADLLRQGLGTPRQACAHWLGQGIEEGRQAHPGFSARHYLSRHSDLKQAPGPRAYADAIRHYVDHGLAEQRIGFPGDAGMAAEAASTAERITIAGNTQAGPLYVSASRRTAGAIDSVMWRDVEFINSFDFGRQLQLALTQGGAGECYNPTEAGGRQDAFDPRTNGASSSVLLSWRRAGAQMSTLSEPAYWMRPGEVDAACGMARNQTLAAGHIRFSKKIEIGHAGMRNVISFQSSITLASGAEAAPDFPGRDGPATIETPTGYLAEQFSRLYAFDPATRTLSDESSRARECAKPGSHISCEQLHPVIFVNPRDVAMGVCAVAADRKFRSPMYGVFAFPGQGSPIANTYKWNVVYRGVVASEGSAEWRFKTLIAVGNLAQVQASMLALHARGECFSQ